MKQNTDTADATLTEYKKAKQNADDSIDGAAKITHIVDGRGLWAVDEGEALDEDPDEYRVECSCGETFDTWGAATNHADSQH